MSRELQEQHWIAPVGAGPRPRIVVAATVFVAALLGLWALFVTDVLLPAEPPRTVRVAVTHAGTVTVDGMRVSAELRTRGATPFVVAHVRDSSRRPLRLDLRLPVGVARERVASWVVQPNGASDGEVLVVVPAAALTSFDAGEQDAVGSVAAVTTPVDRRARAGRSDARLHDRLTGGWWWILPLGALLAGALPAWLWQRHARRFFSMRLPGPGTEAQVGPPSELDPVSVAALIAGAGAMRAGDAFAGHVLDLIERRQLVIRRTLDPALGAGAVIGLAHADVDDLVRDDAAVGVLRSMALEDGITVPLPDAPGRRRTPSLEALAAWDVLVEARMRFMRLHDQPATRRIVVAAALLATVTVASLGVGIAHPMPGMRTAARLAVCLAGPAALLLAAWARDARRWRRITRARRNERAQWIAWADAVGRGPDGPAFDLRNLPLLVAAGRGEDLVASAAGPDAVELHAVTARTIATLRAVAED